MPNPPRSTNNSLSAGLRSEDLPLLSSAPTVVSTAPSGPVAPLAVDSIAEAVVRALGSSLPTIIFSIQGNAPSPLNSSVPGTSAGVAPSSSSESTAVSCDANVSSVASGASSGMFTLPAFVPTFSPVSAITDLSSARFVAPITSPFASSSVASSLPSLGNSASVTKSEKAFIVGPGHAPILAKLAKKIIEGQFVELADLLTVNLRAVEQEPQTFLEICFVPFQFPFQFQFQFQFQLRPALQLSLLLRYLWFLRSHHYSWINFKRSCAIIPMNQL